MRVLFAANRQYLPQAVGGAEWSTHYLCRGLLEKGDDVAVLCELKNRGWLGYRNRLLRRITGHACPADRTMGYPVFRGWNAIDGLADVSRRFKPDAIVVVGAPPNPCQLAMEALKTGCAVFYQVRDTAFDRHGGDLGTLERVTFISNSDYTRQRLNEFHGVDSGVILPPIHAEKYRVSAIGHKVLVVNPDPAKGGELAIALAEQCPEIPFIFQECWSNNARIPDIRLRARRCPNVDWRSPVLDMRSTYGETRILLAASRLDEAWGRVASEAHVNGIPVIASDSGGLRESVGPGGMLIGKDAPISDWVAALRLMWSQESVWQRCSEAASLYAAREQMSPDYQVGRFREILTGVPASPGRIADDRNV